MIVGPAVEGEAVLLVHVRATARLVALLDDGDRVPLLAQSDRRREAAEPAADDDDAHRQSARDAEDRRRARRSTTRGARAPARAPAAAPSPWPRSATAHHSPRPAQTRIGNTPFAAYSASGRPAGDTRAAHSLGGTIASSTRATTKPGEQPSQPVRERHAVEQVGQRDASQPRRVAHARAGARASASSTPSPDPSRRPTP